MITEITALDDGGVQQVGRREIDAEGRLVTPGFVDIHTHLDAQIAWDPIGTSSCWHGVTSVVMGNCGVTFAPCKPEDRAVLAEMMESVEDIPREAILDGLPWDWETYGEYHESIDRLPKGPNAGGLVGHCALRTYVMGERGLDESPASGDDVVAMARLVDEAMSAGALGVSTSRTFLHRVPDGRPVPGTHATADELLAFAEVLGRHGAGVFEGAMRLGERDNERFDNSRSEVALMGEISRQSGRPVSFGLTQSDKRPGLSAAVIGFAHEENDGGRQPPAADHGPRRRHPVRPRDAHAVRPVAVVAAAAHRRQRSQVADVARRVVPPDAHQRSRRPRDPARPRAAVRPSAGGDARYDCDPADSLAAIAIERGVSPAAAFIELALETDGHVVANMPFLNQDLAAVEAMLDDPVVTLGLADAGAHVSQIMDASQPTFFLTYWVRERKRWSIEEAVRRLTSDTADLFGVRRRGRLVAGHFADVNVIDFDGLTLPQPEFVYDFPNGAGRYIQGASGYDHTFVNGYEFMDHGEHTGVLAGRMLRSN